MAKVNIHLKELDIDKLFRENTIENIIHIQKIIDVEIEKKRSELRSMVGYVLLYFSYYFSIIIQFAN